MPEIALADSEGEDDVEAYDFFDEPSTEEYFEAVMTEVQDLPESPHSEINNEPKRFVIFFTKTFRQAFRKFGVQHHFTPLYSPQSNWVERTNRVLKTLICQFSNQEVPWDKNLNAFLFSMNTAKHESMGLSPAYLNFGRELRTPAENMGNLTRRPSALKNLEEIFKIVRERMKTAFEKQSRGYNKCRSVVKFNVGDQVWRKNPVFARPRKPGPKMEPKFIGPYIVAKIVSSNVLQLKDLNDQ
nr:PREDICTED: uncharacterized protein LOC109029749 isoform X1 [Bemisia tabaci]